MYVDSRTMNVVYQHWEFRSTESIRDMGERLRGKALADGELRGLYGNSGARLMPVATRCR